MRGQFVNVVPTELIVIVHGLPFVVIVHEALVDCVTAAPSGSAEVKVTVPGAAETAVTVATYLLKTRGIRMDDDTLHAGIGSRALAAGASRSKLKIK